MAKKKTEVELEFSANTQQFDESIKAMNAEIKTQRKELKLNATELKGDADNADLLAKRQKILTQEQTSCNTKISALNSKIDEAKRLFGDNSKEVKLLNDKLIDAKTQLAGVENEIKSTDAKLNALKSSTNSEKSALEQLNSTISQQKSQLDTLKTEYKNVVLEQGANSKEAKELKSRIKQLNSELEANEKKLKDVENATEDAGQAAAKSAKGGWTTIKQVMADFISSTIQKGIEKLTELGKAVVNIGIEFSSSVSKVEALSGATENEMSTLENRARELGKSTIFTASQVADAFSYMALAGWDTKNMLGGIEGVLNLAAAAQMDLAEASDIVTDGLTAFCLTAEDADMFADTLATAMARSNTDVTQLGEAFKYVGPLAGSMGYSIQDVSLALGTMANSGIKASQGGTSLRRVLQNMISPTDTVVGAMNSLGLSLFNADGSTKPLKTVLDDLRKSLSTGGGDVELFKIKLDELTSSFEAGQLEEEDYNDACMELAMKCGVVTNQLAAQNAAAIAGATGLSGLMAIVSASDEDWNSLCNSLNNSENAAADMAHTMNDNLGGDIQILNSALQEVGHKINDDVDSPLRELTQFATTSLVPALEGLLSKLSEAYHWGKENKGILAGLATTIGVVAVAFGIYNGLVTLGNLLNATQTTSIGGLIVAKWGEFAANSALNASNIALAASGMAALGPVFIAIGIIAILVVGIVLLIKHFAEIKVWAKDAFETAKNKCTEFADGVKQKFRDFGDSIVNGFRSIPDKIGDLFDKLRNKIKTPHISVTYSTEGTLAKVAEALGLQGFPNLHISWNKFGGVFENKTIVAQGFAEAGDAEMALPLNDRSTAPFAANIASHMPSEDYSGVLHKIYSELAAGNSSITDKIVDAVVNRVVFKLDRRVIARVEAK